MPISKEIFQLNNLQIIEITGKDSKKFLQGLITNDLNKINESSLIFSCLLNSNSRFFCDFFITEINIDKASSEVKILLICAKKFSDDLIKKLNFFRLKNQVNIAKNDDLIVLYSFNNSSLEPFKPNIYKDPRSFDFGYFAFTNNKNFEFANIAIYHQNRIKNKICEGEFDLISDKSFIQEFNYDDLSAIDYNKGCYIGQELIARTHHRGEIRKKIFYLEFEIENFNYKINEDFLPLNFLNNIDNLFDLTLNSEVCGKILSCVFDINKSSIFHFYALAQIRINDDFFISNNDSKNLFLENLKKDLKINNNPVILIN